MAEHTQRPPAAAGIDGEPDPVTGTLEEWRAYRRRLAALPRHEAAVRLAIAVAEARIAVLSRRRGQPGKG